MLSTGFFLQVKTDPQSLPTSLEMDDPPVRGLHCSPSQRDTIHTAARKGSETVLQQACL